MAQMKRRLGESYACSMAAVSVQRASLRHQRRKNSALKIPAAKGTTVKASLSRRLIVNATRLLEANQNALIAATASELRNETKSRVKCMWHHHVGKIRILNTVDTESAPDNAVERDVAMAFMSSEEEVRALWRAKPCGGRSMQPQIHHSSLRN